MNFDKNPQKELLLVIALVRHGVRVPFNDGIFHFGANWKFQPGELTELGQTQMYDVGLKVKEIYKGFISEYFDPKEILAVSTQYNRALDSTLFHLKGMFGESGKNWYDHDYSKFSTLFPAPMAKSDRTNEFPILIPSDPTLNSINGYDHIKCPEIRSQIEKIIKKETPSLNWRYKPLVDEFKESIKNWVTSDKDHGFTVADIPDVEANMIHLVDSYQMAKMEGLSLPFQIQNDSMLAEYFNDHYLRISQNPEIYKKLASKFHSFLLNIIINKVKAHKGELNTDLKEVFEDLKYVLVGCHESTIYNYLAFIGVIPIKHIDIGTTIFIEIYKYKSQFYLSYNLNGQYLNLNSKYDELGGLKLEPTLEYIESLIDQNYV